MPAAPAQPRGPEGRLNQPDPAPEQRDGSRQDAGVFWRIRITTTEPQDAASPRGPLNSGICLSSSCPLL